MTQPNTGDEVYLGSMLANLHFWGVVGDGSTPPAIEGSFELSGTDGTVTFDALVGPQGVPGEPSPIVRMQYDANFTDPNQLPTNLTNTSADIGKAYWIGNTVYMWSGTTWYQKQMGTVGPPGPVPRLHFSTQLVTDNSMTSPVEVVQSGTDLNPGVLIKFDAESIRGPRGTAAAIRSAPDYNNTTAPQDGQAICWSTSQNKWVPRSFDVLSIRAYSVPEANFNGYLGIGTRQNIGMFSVPPQPFAWKPLVWGHIRAQGVDLTTDPLTIGCEVTIGDPVSGPRVARGFGNISNYANIMPHFSTPTNKADAITPDNAKAVVAAHHTGTAGNIYISLYNDGAIGEYSFDPTNAQLVVLVVPVSTYS